MGVCYFTYRMFDELDGKQARRTGNASPLGMLFDHGCDSFTVGFMFIMNAKIYYLGDGLFTWIFVILSCFTFHMSTIEQIYTGEMILGVGNGITDTALLSIALIIGVGFFSREYMVHEVYPGLWYTQVNYLMSSMAFAVYIGTISNNFWTIFVKPNDGH